MRLVVDSWPRAPPAPTLRSPRAITGRPRDVFAGSGGSHEAWPPWCRCLRRSGPRRTAPLRGSRAGHRAGGRLRAAPLGAAQSRRSVGSLRQSKAGPGFEPATRPLGRWGRPHPGPPCSHSARDPPEVSPHTRGWTGNGGKSRHARSEGAGHELVLRPSVPLPRRLDTAAREAIALGMRGTGVAPNLQRSGTQEV